MLRRAIAKTVSGLPATFWWLWVGVLVMSLATFVFPFLALYLRSRGFGVGETGLMLSLFGAGSIPSGPLAGWAADRIGRRPALVGSLLAAGAITALMPLLDAPLLLAAATLALGVAVHSYYPVANAMVSDVVPPARYNDAFGLMYWERNAGIAVSFVVGGALASRGYRTLFWADAATTFAFAALALGTLPETRPAAARAGAGGAGVPQRGWGDALADRSLRDLLALNVLQLVALFQFMAALPMVMTQRGFSPEDYGLTMAVNGVAIVLLQPVTGRLAQRFEAAQVLSAAALFVCAGYAGYALCHATWQYALATAVWSVGEILMMPVFSSLVAELSPEDLRGRYQGLFSLSFGIALALSPAVGGICLERFDGTTLWAGTAALSALVAAGQIWAGRRRGPPRARVPA